jgi:hypothetical protein
MCAAREGGRRRSAELRVPENGGGVAGPCEAASVPRAAAHAAAIYHPSAPVGLAQGASCRSEVLTSPGRGPAEASSLSSRLGGAAHRVLIRSSRRAGGLSGPLRFSGGPPHFRVALVKCRSGGKVLLTQWPRSLRSGLGPSATCSHAPTESGREHTECWAL